MDTNLFLIAGLGNPGKKYENTRHNLGFMVVDQLARQWKVSEFANKFEGELATHQFGDRKLFLLKPQTYMNLSGQSVSAVMNFYKIPPSGNFVLVIDDIDIPLGAIRIRKSGSAGGHNGIKSVIASLGTEKFYRLRIGIGRSGRGTSNHVLGKVSSSESEVIMESVVTAAKAVEAILQEGVDKAMSQFNRRGSDES